MKNLLLLALSVVFTAFPLYAQEEQVKPAETVEPPAAQPLPKVEQKQALEKPLVEIKEIEGQITGLSGNFLALTYGQSENSVLEAAFNVDKNVQLSHKRSFKEFKPGDTVKVRYEQETRALEDGRVSRKNTIKSITFLKAAPKELVSQEPSAPSDGSDAPLPLKGTKGR